MNMILKTNQGGQLWLGNYKDATDIYKLKHYRIKHVLTAAAMLNISYPKQLEINHKVINAFDLPTYRMTPHFDEAYQFIQKGLQTGNVLVHCAAGISRSATCVLVYLMKNKGLSFKESLDFTRAKRPIVNPNYGFQKQLSRFELTLKKKQFPKEQRMYRSTIGNKESFEQDRNVVIEFLKQQSNKNNIYKNYNTSFINQNTIISTFQPVRYTRFIPKPSQQLSYYRGKSQNYYEPFQRVIKNPYNQFNGHFLTFKLEAPKIMTIRK